jgi:tetratricopeptide (TPR) repeat protein
MVGVAVAPALGQDLAPQKLYDQANQQFWDGEYERARSSFTKLIENYSDHNTYWDARFGLGRTVLKLGELREARKHFRATRRQHPDKSVRGDALFSLVEVAILLDKTIRAKQLLQTFMDVYPNHVLRPTAKKQLELLNQVDRSQMRARGSAGKEPTQETRPAPSPEQPSEEKPAKTSQQQPDTEPARKTDPVSKQTTDTSRASPQIRGQQTPEQTESSRQSSPSPDKSTQETMSEKSPSPESQTERRISPFQGGVESFIANQPAAGSTRGQSTTEQKKKRTDGAKSTQRGKSPSGSEQAGENQGADRTDESKSKQSGSTEQERRIGPTEVTKSSESPTDNEKTPEQSNQKSGETTPEESVAKNQSKSSEKSPDPSTGDQSNEGMKSNEVSSNGTQSRASKQSPEPPEVTTQKARKLYENGDLGQARKTISSVLQQEVPGAGAYVLAAEIARKSGESSDAILNHLNQAINSSDDPPAKLHLWKADILLEQDRLQEALASLKPVNAEGLSREDPVQASRYYYLRGAVSMEVGNPDQAFFHFMDAVRAAPSSEWANKARTTIDKQL